MKTAFIFIGLTVAIFGSVMKNEEIGFLVFIIGLATSIISAIFKIREEKTNP